MKADPSSEELTKITFFNHEDERVIHELKLKWALCQESSIDRNAAISQLALWLATRITPLKDVAFVVGGDDLFNWAKGGSGDLYGSRLVEEACAAKAAGNYDKVLECFSKMDREWKIVLIRTSRTFGGYGQEYWNQVLIDSKDAGLEN
jgi:hypothetical protein